MNRSSIYQKLCLELAQYLRQKDYAKTKRCIRLAKKLKAKDPFLLYTQYSYEAALWNFEQSYRYLIQFNQCIEPNAKICHELALSAFWCMRYKEALKWSALSRKLAQGATFQSNVPIALFTSNFELEKHLANIKKLKLLGLNLKMPDAKDICPHPQREQVQKSYAKTLGVLGLIAHQNRKDKLALSFSQASLSLWEHPEIRLNIGVAYMDLGDLKLAEEHLKRALETEEHYVAKTTLALVYRKMKDSRKGGALYEFRHTKLHLKDEYAFLKKLPEWKGEPLKGKKVLVVCEEGFGDNIQYARYLNDPLLKKAFTVTLASRKELLSLMKSSFPNIHHMDVMGLQKLNLDWDYQIPMSSLSYVLGRDFHDIPCKEGYLQVASNKLLSFQKKIPSSSKLNVGFCFDVSFLTMITYLKRSISEAFFIDLFNELPEVNAYSLQFGDAERELISKVPSNVRLLGRYLKDYSDTAAAISQLDLVIAPDTSVLHVAGALGVPVWTLLPKYNDWRWFDHSSINPWYDSGALLVQDQSGNWAGVFRRLKALLQFAIALNKNHDKKDLRRWLSQPSQDGAILDSKLLKKAKV